MLVDFEGCCSITVRNSRTYTIKAPTGFLTSADYEKRKNYTMDPPITLARIQQYYDFAVVFSGGLFRCRCRFAVVNEELHTSSEKNSMHASQVVALGLPQALFCVSLLCAPNSGAVVQSIRLQGDAEGGENTDGEDASAGEVQAGAGIGSGRRGRAGGRRSFITA